VNCVACLTWILFSLTYAGLALGKLPGLRIDRAGIALVGAAAFLACGVITLDEATLAIDHETLLLLFAMMIVIAFLRLSGFFERLAAWTLTRVRRPASFLAATIVLSGFLSAFLVNDIVCLAMSPLLLRLTRRLKLNPVPYLIALATAANIGSTATITGNPQNMIIGSMSGISYLEFICRLAPVSLLGLVIDFAVIAWIYRGRLTSGVPNDEPAAPARFPSSNGHTWLLRKSLLVTGAAVALFFTGLPIALVALGAAAILLLGRVRPEKVYSQVDWGLLVMFAGLFVVVHAFELRVVRHWGLEEWGLLQDSPVALLSVISAGLSNLVSNVPAVLLFKPVIPAMPATFQQTAWLALAMSSTLAGNLTVLGSVANLIVVESARRHGLVISFWEFCRPAIPITLLTLALGVAWLSL
jgi:Na+/H+ antiporter NhaD/arsenite permease-like protein